MSVGGRALWEWEVSVTCTNASLCVYHPYWGYISMYTHTSLTDPPVSPIWAALQYSNSNFHFALHPVWKVFTLSFRNASHSDIGTSICGVMRLLACNECYWCPYPSTTVGFTIWVRYCIRTNMGITVYLWICALESFLIMPCFTRVCVCMSSGLLRITCPPLLLL